jgi:hypothetical protein
LLLHLLPELLLRLIQHPLLLRLFRRHQDQRQLRQRPLNLLPQRQHLLPHQHPPQHLNPHLRLLLPLLPRPLHLLPLLLGLKMA